MGVVKLFLWTMWEDPPQLSGPGNALIDQGRRLAVNQARLLFIIAEAVLQSQTRGHSLQAGRTPGSRGLSVMKISATTEINRKHFPSLAAQHQARADLQMRALI